MTTWRAAKPQGAKRRLYHFAAWHDHGFDHDVARDLLWHPGEWRHPGHAALAARGATADTAELALATWRVVDKLRRVGWVVEAEGGPAGRGYRVVDFDTGCLRYLHLRTSPKHRAVTDQLIIEEVR